MSIALPLPSGLTAAAPEARRSVTGAWKPVGVEATGLDESPIDLYGWKPTGLLIYDAEGRMSVQLGNPGPSARGAIDRRKGPAIIARGPFEAYIGYWGRYEVSADGNSVAHLIEGASVPDWVGTLRECYLACAGQSGRRMTLAMPPTLVAGIESRLFITWERAT